MSFFKRFLNGSPPTQLHVVDDSKVFLIGLKKQLTDVLDGDIEVNIHLDSQSLINAVEDNNNHVIIMDFHLDEDSPIDGIELLQVLRKKFPKVPVLVLTGNQDVDIAKQCFKHGASNYIVKNVGNISAMIDEIKYKLGLIKLI